MLTGSDERDLEQVDEQLEIYASKAAMRIPAPNVCGYRMNAIEFIDFQISVATLPINEE